MSLVLTAISLVFGLAVLDLAVVRVLPRAAPALPKDHYGSDGWLIDMRSTSGIFDHPGR